MKYLKNQKGTTLVFELVILAAVLGAAAYAFYVYQQNKNNANQPTKPIPHMASSTPTPTSSPIAGWKTYSSAYEGLSFEYPPSWKLAVATQQVTGWTSVDTVTVTSSTGFVVTFDAHISGLGGGCSPSDCPDVQTVAKEAMPHISGDYFMEQEVRNSSNQTIESRTIGVFGITTPSEVIPSVGTQKGYPYDLGFSSRGVDKALAQLTGSYPIGSQQLSLSTSNYFALPDVMTGKQIIESATY